MMAADYRHIGGRENRLGRHYSRFSAFWPAPTLAGQSLALRKLCDAGSNRRSRASQIPHCGAASSSSNLAVLAVFCSETTASGLFSVSRSLAHIYHALLNLATD